MRVLSIAVVIAACGCKPAAQPDAPRVDGAKPASASSSNNELVMQLRGQLSESERRIKALEEGLPEQAEEKLRNRRNECSKQLQQLVSGDDAGWALLKDKTDRAFKDLREALDRAVAEFS